MKKAILVAIVAGLAWSAQATATENWTFKRSLPVGAKAHGHQLVKAPAHPVRYGEKSERFEVRPGDCSSSSDGRFTDCGRKVGAERSELTSHDSITFGEGDDYWYRWSFFVPGSHKSIYPAFTTFGQFKHDGSGRSSCSKGGLFFFTEVKGDWGVVHLSDIPDPRDPNKKYSYAVLVPEETLTDKWHDVVANIQWSSSKSGRARFWINGKLTKDIQGRNMQPGCPVVYFKYGIYRTYLKRNENAKNITAIAYYDGVRLSKSKDGMFSDLVE